MSSLSSGSPVHRSTHAHRSRHNVEWSVTLSTSSSGEDSVGGLGVRKRSERTRSRRSATDGPRAHKISPQTGANWIHPNRLVKKKIAGKGNFGKVYRAKLKFDHLSKSEFPQVAFKVPKTSSYEDLELLLIEVELLMSLDHENVIRIFGVVDLGKQRRFGFRDKGGPERSGFDRRQLMEEGAGKKLKIGIVMEYCARSLMDSMAEIRDPLWVAHGIAKGIAYLHSLNIVHRDIKPENVLLDDDDNPRLIDLGLSKVCVAEDEMTIGTGSPLFMAPEAKTPSQLLIDLKQAKRTARGTSSKRRSKRSKAATKTGHGLFGMFRKWKGKASQRAAEKHVSETSSTSGSSSWSGGAHQTTTGTISTLSSDPSWRSSQSCSSTGSSGYSSSEGRRGYGPPVDVYAYGRVMEEMMAANEGLPSDFGSRIVEKCLLTDPSRRPSAFAISKMIEQYPEWEMLVEHRQSTPINSQSVDSIRILLSPDEERKGNGRGGPGRSRDKGKRSKSRSKSRSRSRSRDEVRRKKRKGGGKEGKKNSGKAGKVGKAPKAGKATKAGKRKRKGRTPDVRSPTTNRRRRRRHTHTHTGNSLRPSGDTKSTTSGTSSYS